MLGARGVCYQYAARYGKRHEAPPDARSQPVRSQTVAEGAYSPQPCSPTSGIRQTQAGMPRTRAVVDAYFSATLRGHAPLPAMIPMAGIAAADHAAAAPFQADDGQVGAAAAGRIQDMGGTRPCPAASCARIPGA